MSGWTTEGYASETDSFLGRIDNGDFAVQDMVKNEIVAWSPQQLLDCISSPESATWITAYDQLQFAVLEKGSRE